MCGKYWEGNGKYQVQSDILHGVIDDMLATNDGKIPRQYSELERLRKIKNAYYRLFNDGDPNWRWLGVYREMLPTHETWGPVHTSMWNTAAEVADSALDAQLPKAWAEFNLMLVEIANKTG